MPASHRYLTIIAFGIVFGLIFVTGCANTTPRPVFPEITFNHLAPIRMAVSDITVEDRYTAPLTAPNAEHRVPVAPQSVMHRWPGERISQAGGESHAKFIIVTASVTEQALDTDGNITAIFTNEQALRYEVSVDAILEVSSNDGLSQGSTRAGANKSITVAENATLNEREIAVFGLVEETLREFDTQMELNIRKHLGIWLR